MRRHYPVVFTLVPVVVLVGGVPFFSSETRIGPLPALGTWFLIWVLLTPLFVLTGDRLGRSGRGSDV
ncbi:exported hypothetical protein [Nostocoides japonicum T1-X7]|uniref:DUF3311 domain-containing protein n=1 Tax=Nostocoides japonicum T1-X7 TaxID=1194083 RepID=A0A077LU02_9MICO|nr:hypothetical protein [Tetrasphaera japonica]CCH76906.1 exported hypothetical protein [Tetrasphaera japonica T1-X7]